MVLKMCLSYYDAFGFVKDLDDDDVVLKFEHIIQGVAAGSLRCITFATKQVGEEHKDREGNKKVNENDLTLLSIVGIRDPCHPRVKKAVEVCQRVGVNVKTKIRDNVFTAKAIATQCGILQPYRDTKGAAVEGEEFRNYSLEKRLQKVKKISVMAR